MNDLISRQAAIDELSQRYIIMDNPHYIGYNAGLDEAQKVIKALPTVQIEILASGEGELNVPDMNVGKMEPMDVSKTEQADGWMERNKDRILQAGLEGREVEFRIGGRLFAIREKAQ